MTTSKVKWLDEYRHMCSEQMNSWDMRLTRTFKIKNTCEKCFCEIYDMDRQDFRDKMEDFWGIRPCQGL